ncbi:MAG: amidohydrolase [Gammaproteobacteria bacterium]|jgi:predicted TIM-barrel fold metal-dependent hydrolase|nr:amidohydrolase [Gammaproteobacteria bacterium]
MTEPGSNEWLAQVREEIIDPERPIIDPHHHLWMKRFNRNYLLPELWSDTGSGHNVLKTVFMECSAFYYREGPEHLRPVGETEYISKCCRQSREDPHNATVAGIVAHADLNLAGNSVELLVEVLDQHAQKSDGLLRGIRHGGARDKRPQDLFIALQAPAYLYGKESFRKGLRILAEHGLTYDTWHYHHQNLDFVDLARDVPEVTMVLNHFGTPLGVGIYSSCKDEIFQVWKQEIAELAKCENVYAKLGGLAMPDNGFGWHKAERPPTSDEFLNVQKKYYLHTIECFGPQRCMFESNFPVDRLSINYHVLWNAFKKLTADFSEDEKHALFYATAEQVYSLKA